MNISELTKRYYSIGEVAEMFNLRTSVLRFWETEFDQINPRRNKQKRLYTKEDIKQISLIYRLLKQESYTIEGAKKVLKESNTKTSEKIPEKLLKIRVKLQQIRALLD